MTKPLKILLITLLSLLVIGVAGYFIADAVITSKIEDFLENKLPETLSVDYESIHVNIWGGNVVMVQPKIVKEGQYTASKNAEVTLDSIIINGFGYWNYLMHDNISISSIQLRSPKILYHHNKNIPSEEYKSSQMDQMEQEITVDRFNMYNGELNIRDFDTDSLLLQAEQLTFNIRDIVVDNASVENHIPMRYQDYDVSFTDLICTMGEYEKITLNSAEITQDTATFNGLKLFTKYSKAKYDRMLTIERDHYDVTIPTLTVEAYDFGYERDSVFYFKTPKVIFESPELLIYRNKLNEDDLTRKDLYSKMLRKLDFNLTVDNVVLNDAKIEYSEKVHAEMPAGKLSFTKMDADIRNVSNTYAESERTTLDIDAIFMAKTPIKVDWEFDVNDVNDGFVFKADIGRLPAPDLNPFSKPNLKVVLDGELLRTYATISGDANTSRINMRANYEEFKVNILNKEAEKKNKVFSAIANLFIKKDSKKSEDGFLEGSKENIERNKTKSIFNFLWISLKAGLVSVMTGDGKH